MSLAGMSVLLAEDNPTNQMVATHMLESLGAEVTVAHDGAEALEVLGGRTFDVALIDIEMPRISGLDLIRQLRSKPGPAAAMPMIALTAYVMREHRAVIEDAGADGIISKPIVSIGKFGSEILAHVRHRRGDDYEIDLGEDGDDGDDGFDAAVFSDLRAAFSPEGERELVRRIVDDIAEACEGVANAMRTRDFAELRRATHPMMAVAGMIGAERLRVLAMRLNSAGHAEDDDGVERDASGLLLEAERVLTRVCREPEEIQQ